MAGAEERPGGKNQTFPPARLYRLAMVAVTVTPIPVLLLLIFVEVLIVAMRVSMVFHGPLLVVDVFVTIPAMIVAVVGVINTVTTTSGSYQWGDERACNKNQTKPS
jgi:hypothetical protein